MPMSYVAVVGWEQWKQEIAIGLDFGAVELLEFDAVGVGCADVAADDDGDDGRRLRPQLPRSQQKRMPPVYSADLHTPLLLRKLLAVVLPAVQWPNLVGSIHRCC